MEEIVEVEETLNIEEESKINEFDLDALCDIPIQVTAVLGTIIMPINQILKLSKGSVIELDRNIGEPVDIFVNQKLVAKGEVVIVEDKIGVTLTEIFKESK